MTRSSNHFISVSKKGRLFARRKGQPPVEICGGDVGLEVAPDLEARRRGVPAPLFVRFVPGRVNREVRVTDIAFAGQVVLLAQFQRTFEVSDDELGRWMRAAVEEALDRARPAG